MSIIGIRTDYEEVTWHICNDGILGTDHATACGIDPDDTGVGHLGSVEPKRGQKVTCEQCHQMWKGFRSLRLRESSFDLKGQSHE